MLSKFLHRAENPGALLPLFLFCFSSPSARKRSILGGAADHKNSVWEVNYGRAARAQNRDMMGDW
jgi:hypothetical protein